ncbi:MAG: metallophosphoesterase [Nitrososphaeria archaeon]|nr:DNA repair exonuclease [Conexivisphaerales archaeon]
MIAHISDTHLGAMPYGLRERSEDFYDAFNEALEIILKDHIKVVVHSGDVFDSPKPPGLAVKNLYSGLVKLENAGSKMFFVLGEHDISRMKDVPFPLLLEEMGYASYIGDGQSHIIEGITLVGFNKHRRSEIRLLREKLSNLKQNPGKNILVLHQGLVEFHEYAGEMATSDLPAWFDYYAMGHLHDPGTKRFSGLKGTVSYPGATEASGGFNVVDLSVEGSSVERVNLQSSRKSFKFTLDYSDVERGINEILKEISGLRKKPVVTVVIRGKNISRATVNSLLKPVNEASLILQTKFEEEETQQLLSERPADLRSEILAQAQRIMGKEGVFAVEELLPLSKDPEGMAKKLWESFEKGEFD